MTDNPRYVKLDTVLEAVKALPSEPAYPNDDVVHRSDVLALLGEADREAMRLALEALRRHADWCGYNKDAPGDHIYYDALAALEERVGKPDSGRPS